jgi:hypothetical protein
MEFRKLSCTVDKDGFPVNNKEYTYDLSKPLPLVQQANNVEIAFGISALCASKKTRYIIKDRPSYIMYIEADDDLYNIWVVDSKDLHHFPKDYFNYQKPTLQHHLLF